MSLRLEERHCCLCGPGAAKELKYDAHFNEADLNAAVFSARRRPDRIHFRMVECGHCGMIFSDPACSPADLLALYGQATVTYEKTEDEIYDSYAPLLDRALAHVKKDLKGAFVEVGGGSGFMLRYARQKGFERAIEVEPSEQGEQVFRGRGFGPTYEFRRGLLGPGVLGEGEASVACFFQVLDHTPDPMAFLKEVHRALAPGGVALCVTHDTSAMSAQLLGERSPIIDIEHTFLFNPSNLVQLFRKAGFGETSAFAISNRYRARSWLHLAPIPSSAKEFVGKALDATGLADQRIPLRAGNFAVIASA